MAETATIDRPKVTGRIYVEPREFEAVVTYIREHALGPSNAKTRKQIEAAFGVDMDRIVREIGRLANERGIPVCSSDAGYYYATCAEDVRPMLSRLRHQRESMHNRIMAVEMMIARNFR